MNSINFIINNETLITAKTNILPVKGDKVKIKDVTYITISMLWVVNPFGYLICDIEVKKE